MERRGQERKAKTRLAAVRIELGATQKRMAEVTGLSLTSYRRLERGVMRDPPLTWLRNCAIALDVELDEILEDKWGRIWTQLDARAAEPPGPDWHLTEKARQRKEMLARESRIRRRGY